MNKKYFYLLLSLVIVSCSGGSGGSGDSTASGGSSTASVSSVLDFDNDGFADAVDDDDDNDGLLDVDDQWPLDATKPVLSAMWGAYGEDWSATGRLPFVAMAGYRDGAPIPNVTRVVADVTNPTYGAVEGTGKSDAIVSANTQAFIDAIDDATVSPQNHGVVYVPAGVFEVDKIIALNKSGIVLRGAGRDTTEIRFVNNQVLATYGTGDGDVTVALEDKQGLVSGAYVAGLNWKHNGNPDFSSCLDSTQLPSKGDRVLKLSSDMTTEFLNRLVAQGNRVRIAQWIHRKGDDSIETPNLVEQIYGGELNIEASGNGKIAQEFIATIVDNKTLRMDRPLRFTPTDEKRFNIAACVSVRNTSVTWEVEDVGIEDLTVSFDGTEDMRGHNGIGKTGIQIYANNSWVRNVKVNNSDNAINIIPGTSHNTIENVEIDSTRDTSSYGPGDPYFYQRSGHTGITVCGFDHLVNNFTLKTSFIHDVSMRDTQGSVVMNGKGVQMNMDHHRQVIYSNVWTNIDLGVPFRMWVSTGDGPEGFQSASLNTFWNIISEEDPNIDNDEASWPSDGNWGYFKQNYIAVKGLTEKPLATDTAYNSGYYNPDDIYLESVANEDIWPQNIYEAQRSAYEAGTLLQD